MDTRSIIDSVLGIAEQAEGGALASSIASEVKAKLNPAEQAIVKDVLSRVVAAL